MTGAGVRFSYMSLMETVIDFIIEKQLLILGTQGLVSVLTLSPSVRFLPFITILSILWNCVDIVIVWETFGTLMLSLWIVERYLRYRIVCVFMKKIQDYFGNTPNFELVKQKYGFVCLFVCLFVDLLID
jgi:hypothetical protein